jgi:Xaa-Pro aminopeptidase
MTALVLQDRPPIRIAADGRSLNPVSRNELERRWAATRASMVEAGVDVIVVQGANGISGGGHFRWLAGQPPGNYNPRTLIFPASGLTTLVDQGPFDAVVDFDGNDPTHPGVERRYMVPSYPSVAYTADYDAEIVVNEIRRRGYRRVGLLATASSFYPFTAYIRQQIGEENIVDMTDRIDVIKAVKSQEEINLIQATADMQDRIIAEVLKVIRPGMREFEVMAHAQHVGQLLGSEQGMFFGSSAPSGKPAVLRPRFQQGRELRDGDMFTLLVENSGPGGAFAHIARPIVFGKASDEIVDAFAAVQDAQQVTLELLRPEHTFAEMMAQYNAYMRKRGHPEERRLHCHGQGYDLVERPLMREDETMALAANMNIAAHPAIATSSVFMTLCENYLIRESGSPTCFHKTPQQIFEL